MKTPVNFTRALQLLVEASIDFILIGGAAASTLGLGRATYDIDVVYSRSRENIARLVAAMRPLEPYMRGAPPGLPFVFDEKTVKMGLNFTLTTKLGDIDLLGEVAGGGTYEELRPFTDNIEAFGITCRCVTLERLIQLKRAAGRPRDLEVIADLLVLLEERREREGC